MQAVVIVGASVAGVHAAKALRAAGYDGALHLLSAERELPYDRPPLSKGYLLGREQEEDIALAPAPFYSEARIALHSGVRAAALRPGRVALSDGRTLPFDRLLLATGSRLRRLVVPGAEREGILYLRTLGDARALRARLDAAKRVAVVGGGFIGLEVAAAARELGKDTWLIEALEAPLARALGGEAARAVSALHERRGTRIVTRAEVVGFEGGSSVQAVRLQDGRMVPCDLAVVGVGVAPRDELLAGDGQGVRVDERLETASPNVFAAGDVARFPFHGEKIRIEHWDNAKAMGEHAAKAMLGAKDPYEASPFFWSDQFDVTYQYFGHAGAYDRVVLRGDLEAQDFIAFYLQGGAVVAAFAAGRPRDALALRRLVRRRPSLDPADLAREDVRLKTLSR